MDTKKVMESPNEIPNNGIRSQVRSLGNRTPSRGVAEFAEGNLRKNCNCENNDDNDALKKEDQESADTCACKTTEEAVHSTPLKFGCCRRQSSHSIGSCSRTNTLRTPVNNAGRTPLKVPRSPFGAVPLDRLHLPICSPSIFTNVKSEEDEFKWNIEQQAILFPAPIEEEFHRYHHVYEQYDPETESKLQAAIDRFYESKLIAPSPWTDTKKNGFVRGCPSATKVFPGNVYSRARDSDSFSVKSSQLSPRKHNVGTQTEISLPFKLPPELESLLQNYKLPSPPKEESSLSAMESESFSSSTLRRKLFSHMEEMSITQSPCHLADKAPPSPIHYNVATSKAFTPDRYKLSSPYFHPGLKMDEEVLQDFLESSQTTFWRERCSPAISPIAKESVSEISKDTPDQKKSACDPTFAEFTPPSSRSKHKPIFPINFAPLLEMEEDYENIETKEILKTKNFDNNPSQTGGFKDLTSGYPLLNPEMFTKENQNNEGTGVAHDVHCNSKSVTSRTEVLLSQKSDTVSISNQLQAQGHDRVYSMEVSDCGTSHTQDTGYQTGNTTNFPSSMSFNFSKTRNGLGMSTDAAAVSDRDTVKSRICEDGYMSITSIKLPIVTEYDDESMCDGWHATPFMASSTPAKNVTGLLM